MLYIIFIVVLVYLAISLLVFVLMAISAIITPDQKFGVKGGIEFAFLFGVGWGIFVLVVVGNLVEDLKAKLRGKT